MAILRFRFIKWILIAVGIFLLLFVIFQVPVSAGIISSATPTPNAIGPGQNPPVNKNARVASMQYFTDKGVQLTRPQPQGTSQLVLDTWTDEPSCAPSPDIDRMHLGTAWNAEDPGGDNGWLIVDSFMVWLVPQVTASYQNVNLEYSFWDTWNGNTADPVFDNGTPSYIVLGPQSYTAGNYYGYVVSFSYPNYFSNLSNLGIMVDFAGDTGNGPIETNDLTPLICYGGWVAVGSVPNIAPPGYSYGWYQDVTGHYGYNFNRSDAWYFSDPNMQNSALQLKITGHRDHVSVTSVDAQVNGSSGPVNIVYGTSSTGKGNITGTGYGTVTYHWEYKRSINTSWYAMSDLTTNMIDPLGTIPATLLGWFAGGTWEVRAVTISPNIVTSNIVTVNVSETASAPTSLSGPSPIDIYTSNSYSTGGSTCPDGTNVEYQFDWGDGTQSDWSSSTSTSHMWSSNTVYTVKAHARCFFSPSNISDWSPTLNVIVVDWANFQTNGTDDGWVLESAAHSGVGGTLNSTSPILLAGDDTLNRQYRSILSFNTSWLPDTTVITSLTLKVKQQPFMTLIYPSLAGGNPFSLGNLVADIHKGYFGSVAGLEIGDFQATADISNAGTFGSTPVSDWYTATLAQRNSTFINRTGTTQFRLRFTTDSNNNNAIDNLQLYSGKTSTTANRPVLIIKYYVP